MSFIQPVIASIFGITALIIIFLDGTPWRLVLAALATVSAVVGHLLGSRIAAQRLAGGHRALGRIFYVPLVVLQSSITFATGGLMSPLLMTTIAPTFTTALFEDMSRKLQERLPVVIGVVLGLSFLLLLVVFRSVLVPIKAVIMNLLSIGAAYGLIVAIFQWGWGADLVGIGREGPIESFLPMMMFAILFGLSMDYEVFLLSRIKEEFDRTGDNSLAVADGLSATARVITAAALIMVTVFGSFILSDERVIKMFGIGLAAAILIDATIVRMVLVPATMELLGKTNWWFPRWLQWLPKIHVEGSAEDIEATSVHDEPAIDLADRTDEPGADDKVLVRD